MWEGDRTTHTLERGLCRVVVVGRGADKMRRRVKSCQCWKQCLQVLGSKTIGTWVPGSKIINPRYQVPIFQGFYRKRQWPNVLEAAGVATQVEQPFQDHRRSSPQHDHSEVTQLRQRPYGDGAVKYIPASLEQ
jgi:hypothetical protein